MEFKVDDMVWLDSRNIKTTRPNKSLDHKNLGPFKIIRIINNMAFELELPQEMKMFPVFYPWLLHLDDGRLLPGQGRLPPAPIKVDEDGEKWGAEEVVDSKINKRRNNPMTNERGCLMYKIQYDDRGPPFWTIYPDIAGYQDLVADFHHKYPEKPGPHQSFKTPYDWIPLLVELDAESEEEATPI